MNDLVLWDGLDAALIGYVMNDDLLPVAVYDYQKALDVLIEDDALEYLDAVEYLHFNVLNAGVGSRTPLWLFPANAEELRDVEETMNS